MAIVNIPKKIAKQKVTMPTTAMPKHPFPLLNLSNLSHNRESSIELPLFVILRIRSVIPLPKKSKIVKRLTNST